MFKMFIQYLKAVFLESGRLVLTIFDIMGIVLFFLPLQNIQFGRVVGGGIFLLLFIIANFTLFRKYSPQVLDDQSLLLYPYRTKTSNAVQMKYLGTERANELVVMLSYKDKSGQIKQIKVNQFFPSSDPQMLYNAGPIWFLEPGQEVYFYLFGGEENSEEKVTVLVTFTGAKTGTLVKIDRVFPIDNNVAQFLW